MPRSKGGNITRKQHKKVLKQAKGYFSARHRLVRTAMDAVDKALNYAYVGRRLKKRDFRNLWQIKIGAAAKQMDTSFSKFMGALKKNNIILNRKMLADIAENHPEHFKELVKKVSK